MDILGADVRRVSNFSRVVTEQEQGEMLSIEDLLDFSNDDVMGPIDRSESHGTTVASSNFPSGNESRVSSSFGATPERLMKQHQTITLFDGGEGASADLYVPCDDLAELEWLSNFVEESFSSADGAVLQNVLVHDEKVQKGEDNKQLGGNPASVFDHQRRGTHDSDSRHVGSSSSSSSIGADAQLILTPNQLRTSRPARARSKRRRSEACFWNTRILSIVDDCKILEASSTSELTDRQRFSSASSSSDSEGASTLRYGCPVDFCMHEAKKVTVSNITLKFGTRKEVALGIVKGSQLVGGVGDRKCLHCGSQRTPQWRAGPMGPKTLCNACGVRYKSGRLLPEYRPAASPTFMESIHSNSHRRVLEMRKQRADTPFGSDHADQIGVCST